MTHTVINEKNGNYMCDEHIIVEISRAIFHKLKYTYFNKQRIDIKKTDEVDGERTTFIEVEGI